jgi:hypothetical protein
MRTIKPRRLPARYATLLMPFILSILMSGIVSFIATVKHIGLADGLMRLWLDAWQISWVIAFPALLIVLPIVRWIVSILVEPAPPAC